MAQGSAVQSSEHTELKEVQSLLHTLMQCRGWATALLTGTKAAILLPAQEVDVWGSVMSQYNTSWCHQSIQREEYNPPVILSCTCPHGPPAASLWSTDGL